jgi:membrane protease YdiL (CAAX protease family)
MVPNDLNLFLQNLVIVPFLEELVYRCMYLSSLTKIIGKNYSTIFVGIILSSMTFAWIHPSMPYLKLIGGFVLGSIYFYKWKKNFPACVLAHFGMNLVGTFLYVMQ